MLSARRRLVFRCGQLLRRAGVCGSERRRMWCGHLPIPRLGISERGMCRLCRLDAGPTSPECGLPHPEYLGPEHTCPPRLAGTLSLAGTTTGIPVVHSGLLHGPDSARALGGWTGVLLLV